MQKSVNDMAQKTDQKPLAILAPLVIIESDAYPESCYTELFPWKPVNFNISFLQMFYFSISAILAAKAQVLVLRAASGTSI